MRDLSCGEVVWGQLNPTVGSEQSGHRPALIVAANDYLNTIPNVVIVVPITTKDRSLPNHVRLDAGAGLPTTSFAMTEQPRTVDRRRITGYSGHVSAATFAEVKSWLATWLGFPVGTPTGSS